LNLLISPAPEHAGWLTDLEVRKDDIFFRCFAGDDLYLGWQLIFILLSDSDIHSRQIYEFVVEGYDPFDADDITPMHTAEQALGKDAFPLLQRYQNHRASVCHDETGIVFTGFDVDDIMHVYLYIPAILANKEK